MVSYFLRRAVYMVVTLAFVSVAVFIIIQLPPGDYLTTYLMQLEIEGGEVSDAEIRSLTKQLGLDQPLYSQYLKWMGNILKGDFGRSFRYQKPVNELILERLPISVSISLFTLIFTYLVAIPIGIYSATHQYSVGDYFFTIIGFAGLAIPNFILALALMFVFSKYLGFSVGGLFSPEYVGVPWSFGKFFDLFKHLPIPIIVIGTAGTAGLIRVMRGCLLDELRKQYVITARAKGLSEPKLLFKYPVRIALNPIISTVGWILPRIVSGATITSIVLSMPTIGAMLYEAIRSQDMYLAGSLLMILTILTVIGTLISDLMLMWTDPRITYTRRA